MRTWLLIGFTSIVLFACNLAHRETSSRLAAPPKDQLSGDLANTQPSISDQETSSQWVGYQVVRKVLHSEESIETIVLIDSGSNMEAELSVGFSSMMRAFLEHDRSSIDSDYEIESNDRTILVLDNLGGLFSAGERTEILDYPVSTDSLISVSLDLLSGQIPNAPEIRPGAIINLIYVTDSDISSEDRDRMISYITDNDLNNRIHIHTIAFQESSQANEWCQGGRVASMLNSLSSASLPGKALDICDSNWFSHFRQISKQTALNYGIASFYFSNVGWDALGDDLKLRIDQLSLPSDVFTIDKKSARIWMPLINAPRPFATVEIGRYMGAK